MNWIYICGVIAIGVDISKSKKSFECVLHSKITIDISLKESC